MKIAAAAREWSWALTGRSAAVLPPSWELDFRVLERCTLRWPARYAWPPARIWADPILAGMRSRVRVEHVEIPQPYRGIVSFEWRAGGTTAPVALDYWDHPVVDQRCAERSAVYFKMQHLAEGYGLPNVLPGGFVPARPRGRPELEALLRRTRRERATGRFAFDVYGRFSPTYAVKTRETAVRLLREASDIRYGGGLELVTRDRSLLETARARVCLDLPGNGDFCHRLVEYLAVGACVVAPRHRTVLHVPLEDGVHVAYAQRDLSDLAELCRRYAGDSEERERLAENARDFFDRYLHRDQLGAYYLHELSRRAPPT